MKTNQVLIKKKNNLILKLNSQIYKPSLVKKALKGSDWVENEFRQGKYVCLQLKEKDKLRALGLGNYLLYLMRSF